MLSLHLVLPGFEENGDMGAESKREVRESKCLNECFFYNRPTLHFLVLPRGSLTQDLVQETISDGINSFVLTFSTATKPSKSTPLHTANFLV